ncbi:ATP-binding protein [uncultured Limnohabitans sp.]|uniref:sensor histidine kinase n=1 Tax=uncultured Limnohabitans sp. TaxID=768543 RepID=UPI00262C855D|nr:ATP-binding protein [uncultured Limnohabitans sp.]
MDSSARYWVVATLLIGASTLATVFRDTLTPLWSYSVPIGLSGTSYMLMAFGLSRLYDQGPQLGRLVWLALGTVVYIAVMEWSRIHAGSEVTLLLSGGLFGVTSLWGAYFAHAHYQHTANRFAMHMRWVMASLGLFHLLRTQGFVTGWGLNTFGQEAWTYGIWTGAFVAGMLRYFAYFGIRVQEQADERLKVMTALVREEEGRRLGNRLAQQDRHHSLGVMSASFAHELNQPLTAILNYAELLQHQQKSGQWDPQVSERALDDIIHNSVRAGDIIRRIRNFIQPASLNKELVDLRGVIDEVCALVQPEARRGNMEIVKPARRNTPMWVLGDAVQLSQVLFNVVRNAMESVEKAQTRSIRLDIRQENREILIEVHDTGPGLSEAAAEQAGDPFYTTKISGLGMGLSISKTILAQFGGRLSLQNTENGACARIALPFAQVV